MEEFLSVDVPLSTEEQDIIAYAKTHDIKRVELAELGFTEYFIQRCIYKGYLVVTDEGVSKKWQYVDGIHEIKYFSEKHKKILHAIAEGQTSILEISHSIGVKSPNFLYTLKIMVKAGAPIKLQKGGCRVTMLTREG